MDRGAKVIKNHDRFTARESGVTGATPEALAGFFPMGYDVDPDVERATLEFHLGRVDPFVGTPMLSAPLGVYAAMLGDRRRSATLFERGFADFVDEPYSTPNEFSLKLKDKPRAGPLFANLGGFLMSCLFGLSGIRLSDGDPQEWPRRPVVMPACWDGVEVERLWVRGRPATLRARHGDERATLELGAAEDPITRSEV
jgi:hypothetical protein